MADRHLHPLGLTADAFVAAYPRLHGGTLPAYRRLFREGVAPDGFEAPVAPIVRDLREESPEGTVVKFVQDLGRGTGLRPVSGTDSVEAMPALARDATSGAVGGRKSQGPEPRATAEVESVLIPMVGRRAAHSYTLCVSSQIGCAMGCTFCETAQMGLIRSLEPHEIVGQWFAATHAVGIRPKNIVFMGMGEPMDNIENVIRAIDVLRDHNGAHVAVSHITVSTVGRLDGLARLAEQVHKPGWHRLNLAVSINAPNDEVRSRIMPINRAMPMGALREALLAWPGYGAAKLCLEYVLIPGVNDAPEHARQIAEWARPLPACINLIPYNPRRDSPWPAPEESRVEQFLAWLAEAGAYAKRRRTKGRDLMGACGQLGNPHVRKRKLVGVTVGAPDPGTHDS